MITKQIMICDAIIDMLKIFADTEIGGQYEINYEVLSQCCKTDINRRINRRDYRRIRRIRMAE